MLQEKQFYLKQLEGGKVSHKRISNRMREKFSISPALIKDELLRSGHIELDYTKRTNNTNKLEYFFKLTGKKLVEIAPQIEIEQKSPEMFWADGTPKSKGNAFDWRNVNSKLFTKREIVQAQQKYHNNNPITIYSRA